MTNPAPFANDDLALACRLAREAGERLLSLQQQSALVAKALGDEADRLANEYLLAELARERAHDAVLSEEAIDNRKRLSQSRVWIIDPLDGTREFRELRDDWAVHVALAEAGVVTHAAVAMPARGELFASETSVSRRVQEMLQVPRRVVISRSRPPAFAERVAAALDASLVQVGSAGAKAMMVVRGDALAYVHSGGMNEWDAAAPVGVALAHGLHVSTLANQPIRFNQSDVVLHEGLVVCRTECVAAIMDALADIGSERS
ncbi:MAG: 3'(2'),5'-bisphosphate nucleotidase CysQ [Betaproteobacteria bacterium]|nr:MAG: 3'(2'),5'-bisphosphate nucleotidase CysQ [Betaproteobacteria bacterium]